MSRLVSAASPCLCGELQNISFSKASKQVHNLALRDRLAFRGILTCLTKRPKVILRDRRNLQGFQKMTLHVSWQAQHFGRDRRRSLDKSCCMLWRIALTGRVKR